MNMGRYIRNQVSLLSHTISRSRLNVFQNRNSWTGSAGSKKGDANVYGLLEDLNEPVNCCRAALRCNGIDLCQHFNLALLDAIQRYEADRTDTQPLWEKQLTAHEAEGSSARAATVR